VFAEYLIAEKYAYISQHKEIKNATHRATSWIPLRKTSRPTANWRSYCALSQLHDIVLQDVPRMRSIIANIKIGINCMASKDVE